MWYFVPIFSTDKTSYKFLTRQKSYKKSFERKFYRPKLSTARKFQSLRLFSG